MHPFLYVDQVAVNVPRAGEVASLSYVQISRLPLGHARVHLLPMNGHVCDCLETCARGLPQFWDYYYGNSVRCKVRTASIMRHFYRFSSKCTKFGFLFLIAESLGDSLIDLISG